MLNTSAMTSHNYKKPREIGKHAKALRKQAPPAERKFWKALNEARKQTGLHFRRQHPLPPYFADFACVKARLVVELDGMSHDMRQTYDARRDTYIRQQGWHILRFTNDEVEKNLGGVVQTILETSENRLGSAHPLPLPQAGGE